MSLCPFLLLSFLEARKRADIQESLSSAQAGQPALTRCWKCLYPRRGAFSGRCERRLGSVDASVDRG